MRPVGCNVNVVGLERVERALSLDNASSLEAPQEKHEAAALQLTEYGRGLHLTHLHRSRGRCDYLISH